MAKKKKWLAMPPLGRPMMRPEKNAKKQPTRKQRTTAEIAARLQSCHCFGEESQKVCEAVNRLTDLQATVDRVRVLVTTRISTLQIGVDRKCWEEVSALELAVEIQEALEGK